MKSNKPKRMKQIISDSLRITLKNPLIIIPFVFVAVLEGLWLSICYYFPRPPVSVVLAPLVSAFMGKEFLHYPLNFLVLPRLIFIGRGLIYLTTGAIAFAMTVFSVNQVKIQQNIRMVGNFNHALRRMWALCLSGLMYAVFAVLFYKGPQLLLLKFFIDADSIKFLFWLVNFGGFLMLVCLESFLIYLPLDFLIKKHSFLMSFKNLFVNCKKYFWITFCFLSALRFLNFLMIVLRGKSPVIINKFFPLFPEFYLVVLGVEILIFFLVNASVVVLSSNVFISGEEKYES